MFDNVTILSHAETGFPAASQNVLPSQEMNRNEDQIDRFQRLPIQRKLSIGSPDDPLEHEADSMADRVMRMPEKNFIQRKCAHCEEEEKVQRKPLASFIQRMSSDSGMIAADGITQQINSTKGSGSSMDSSTKSFMENRFGADFSGVKLHTGDYAVQMSQELNAQAFTVGSDIYFNSNKYNPGSDSGKHLLAHELTHTVQQNSFIQTKLIQRSADTCTYGEIRQWAINSQRDLTAPAGLADAKASIGAACGRGQPCNCVDGSTAAAAGDRAAWANIVAAAGGTDNSAGGNFMCVGTENCWFVHQCLPVYRAGQPRPALRARTTNLQSVGTVTVRGNTVYFYNDPHNGNCP